MSDTGRSGRDTAGLRQRRRAPASGWYIFNI